jgi:osmoprotectant transport system permease protein
MSDFLTFFFDNLGEITSQIIEHIELTLLSLVFSTLFGIAVGVLLTRRRKFAAPVIGVVNVIQTIPSIALLGFLLPLFGIGVLPAIIALFLYALLPIVRNTYTGIQEIDTSIIEAARGMGMTNAQILGKIELPLALPIIFAGVRTASVINVGVATLSAFIAAGGLGEFIFKGIQLNNPYMILAGAIPASILALLFDTGLGIVQNNIKTALKPFLGFIFLLGTIYTFQQFSGNEKQFIGGFPNEFIEREDGLKGMFETYAINFDYLELDAGLMYDALKNKKVDVISGFSTDGRIKAYNLFVLKDDKNYFPPYDAAPLIREETLQQYPELEETFRLIEGKLTDEIMTGLNYQVDHLNRLPYDVAEEFMESLGLKTTGNNGGSVDLVIGSKAFTENYILAQLFGLLIENYTTLNTELKLGFGGTKLLMDAVKLGEVDIYPEYSGTALLLMVQPEQATVDSLLENREKVFPFVKEQTRKLYGIEWLPELGFNNTFALLLRTKDARKWKAEEISDLKNVVGTSTEGTDP